MSKDNYHPIAPASVVSKVAESIIFNRISCYLDTCPNQFGFKRNHGTDQCIYVLKEIIYAYRVMNGSVFTCLLDASKAFDRVNHCILFTKLGNREPPICYSHIVFLVRQPADVHTLGWDIFYFFQCIKWRPARQHSLALYIQHLY